MEPHPNEFIFRFDKSTASKYFKMACVDKGIVDLRLRDLRHEATSALFEDGWDIPEVAAVTGHKDWRNLKRYTNLRPADVALKGRNRSVAQSGSGLSVRRVDTAARRAENVPLANSVTMCSNYSD